MNFEIKQIKFLVQDVIIISQGLKKGSRYYYELVVKQKFEKLYCCF